MKSQGNHYERGQGTMLGGKGIDELELLLELVDFQEVLPYRVLNTCTRDLSRMIMILGH